MSKIRNIECYWNNCLTNNDNWGGKILVEDDGWFEGIVVDPNSSYFESRFVFGVYHEDKTIELFKLSPITISNPFRFSGNINDGKYDGEFSIITENGEFPYGGFTIKTNSLNTENEKLEIKILKASVESWKNSVMDDTCKQLYQNILSIRTSMTEIVLRNHEGRGFNSEEFQRIVEEFQATGAIIIGEQDEVVKDKNLVKKFSYDPFEDDVLPF